MPDLKAESANSTHGYEDEDNEEDDYGSHGVNTSMSEYSLGELYTGEAGESTIDCSLVCIPVV